MGHSERHKPGRSLRIGGWLPNPRRARSSRQGQPPALDSDATQLLPVTGEDGMVDLAATQAWGSGPTSSGEPRRRRGSRRNGLWLRIAAPAAVLIVVGAVVGVTRLLATNPDHPDLAKSASPFQPEPSNINSSEAVSGNVTARAGRLPVDPSASASQSVAPKSAGAAARSPSPTKPRPMSYEAEAAQLSGGYQVQPKPNASGGKVVSLGWRAAATFTVASATAADHQVTIAFACSDRRTATLRVNNSAQTNLMFDRSGGTSQLTTMTITVRLNAGSNTIQLIEGYGSLVLDVITVT